MKKFFKWLGTAVEDQNGGVSSKRLIMYWSMFLLTKMSTNVAANEELIWPIVALIFGLAGVTIPEWFNKIGKKDE
jgi:hypothetical protein